MRTHGVHKLISKLLVSTTKGDTMIDGKPIENERGDQISTWIMEYRSGDFASPYVVLDDLDLGIRDAGHPFTQTDGKVGLTFDDARRIISLLT